MICIVCNKQSEEYICEKCKKDCLIRDLQLELERLRKENKLFKEEIKKLKQFKFMYVALYKQRRNESGWRVYTSKKT